MRHWTSHPTARRLALHFSVGGLFALLLAVGVPFVGGEIHLAEALRTPPWSADLSPSAMIFWQTRLPRVLASLGCGAALAMAGVVFQAVLRNPLAEPYILGVSGGAALGKALLVLFVTGSNLAILGLSSFAAFGGALVPVAVLHLLSRQRRHWSPETILLGGVVMNVLASALLLLIQFFSDFTVVRQMFTWMLGGLDIVGYTPLTYLWPTVIGATVLLTWLGRQLNILTLGPIAATHLGINVPKLTTRLVWIAALLTAVCVAVAGPIGFVGLIVPHIVRSIVGSDHRLLVPLSALYGGTFLLVCDFLGWRGLELLTQLGVRVGTGGGEIPVGIITACVGGVFFLFILFRRGRTFEE